MFKLITCIKYIDELVCNPDEIADTLTARYAEVSRTESYSFDFLARKAEVEQNLNLGTERCRTNNVAFRMRESAVRFRRCQRYCSLTGGYSLQCHMSAAGCTYGYTIGTFKRHMDARGQP